MRVCKLLQHQLTLYAIVIVTVYAMRVCVILPATYPRNRSLFASTMYMLVSTGMWMHLLAVWQDVVMCIRCIFAHPILQTACGSLSIKLSWKLHNWIVAFLISGCAEGFRVQIPNNVKMLLFIGHRALYSYIIYRNDYSHAHLIINESSIRHS